MEVVPSRSFEFGLHLSPPKRLFWITAVFEKHWREYQALGKFESRISFRREDIISPFTIQAVGVSEDFHFLNKGSNISGCFFKPLGQ